MLGIATLASSFASLPAAIRADASFFGAWISLTGIALVPMLVLLVLFRMAREGLRALEGDHVWVRALGALSWLFASFSFFSKFGSLLRAKTHHHALAGVTFAIGSVLFMIAMTVLVVRLVRAVEKRPSGNAIMALVTVLVAIVLVRSVPSGLGSDTRAALVDGCAWIVALVLGASDLSQRHRALALVGPPLGLVCLLVAFVASSSVASAPIHRSFDFVHQAR